MSDVVPLQRLDNIFPATWETVWSGVHPEPTDPYSDEATRARFVTREDAVNYWTQQRQAGDLFKRDLIKGVMIRRILDYLAARSGLFFNLPLTNLPEDAYLPLGSKIGTSQIEGYYLAAFSLNVDEGDFASLSLRVVDVDTEEVIDQFTPTAEKNLSWVVATNNINGERGGLVDNFEVRLYNSGSAAVKVSASAVLSPKLAWDDSSAATSSSSSSGL